MTDAVVSGGRDLFLSLESGASLLASCAPDRGRLMLTDTAAGPDARSPEWARRHLVNARIEAVGQPLHERILHVDAVKRDRLGAVASCRLVAELTGRHANVILLTRPKLQVVAALRHVTGKMSRQRQIAPGRPYTPPPPQSRLDPRAIAADQLESILGSGDQPPQLLLARAVAGLDPLAAREILARAGTPDAVPSDAYGLERLAAGIRAFVSGPPFRPGAALVQAGRPLPEVCVFDTTHPAIRVEAAYDTVSAAVAAADAAARDPRPAENPAAELKAEVSRLLKSARRKADRIAADLEEAGQAERFEQFGNLLMANLHAVPPMAPEVCLDDLFGPPGSQVTIPLRQDRLPRENALNYLKKGRKGRRAAPILSRRLDEARARCEALETWLAQLREADTAERVRRIEREMEREKLLKEGRGEGGRVAGGARPTGPRPRRYRTSEGWTVLVGRNDRENDELTRTSAGEDIFLHAHGCPGSHVILKREGRPDMPSRQTLGEAAGLAAWWSKARHAGKVPVVYTEVRHVSKPRGAKHGLVTLRNEKTVMARPEELPRADEG